MNHTPERRRTITIKHVMARRAIDKVPEWRKEAAVQYICGDLATEHEKSYIRACVGLPPRTDT